MAPRITLNPLAEMMLRTLCDALRREPKAPGGDDAEPSQDAERAAQHYEWTREVNAYRILLGIQLIKCALEQVPE